MLHRNVLTGLVAVSVAAVLALPLYASLVLAPSFSRIVIESAQKDAERIAVHLAAEFFGPEGLIPPSRITPEFRAAAAGHLAAYGLERLKVFNPDGVVTFSTDPAEEGDRNTRVYFAEVVARGRTHTSLVRRDAPTQEGRRVSADIVETYVPVMRAGTFAGAFEVYYDVTGRLAEVERLLGSSGLIVLLMACGLGAAVAVSTRRAARAVRERDRAAAAVQAERDRLEEAVAERTASLRGAKEALERDVARRVSTEEALRESEERASAIAGSSLDAIFVLDGEGRIAYLNPAAEAMCGRPAGEVRGRVFHEVFVSPEAREHYDRLLPAFRRDGRCPVMEGVIRRTAYRRDGTAFPVELCIVPVRIRGAWHAVGTMRDIGERLAAERERERLISELTDALEGYRALQGIVPVCSACKKVRDDRGYWRGLEEFLAQHTEAEVSRGICPDCAQRLSNGAGGEGAVPALSPRELEVLSWVRRGKSTWEIGRILGISERTVKFHVAGVMRKLDAVTRTQAVANALELGILEAAERASGERAPEDGATGS